MPTKSVSKYIDELYAIKQKVDAQAAILKKLNAQYDKKEKEILKKFTKEELKSVKTKKALASMSSRTLYNVESWDKFYAYIYKTKAFDLLQRRPSNAGIEARLEADKTVPGICRFTKIGLTLRGAKDGKD